MSKKNIFQLFFLTSPRKLQILFILNSSDSFICQKKIFFNYFSLHPLVNCRFYLFIILTLFYMSKKSGKNRKKIRKKIDYNLGRLGDWTNYFFIIKKMSHSFICQKIRKKIRKKSIFITWVGGELLPKNFFL
jgi:hypothetical protein